MLLDGVEVVATGINLSQFNTLRTRRENLSRRLGGTSSNNRGVRVVYIIGGLGVGGAERQLLALVESIAHLTEVVVVSLSSRGELLSAFRQVPGVRVIVCAKRLGLDPVLLIRLVRILRRERPTIVHTILRTANYWGRTAAWLARVPIRIASERNIEVERGRLSNNLDVALSWLSDRVVVNAETIRNRLVENGVKREKIELIHNGVRVPPRLSTSARVELREKLSVRSSEHLVVFVGRLVRQKNPRLFLRMARRVCDRGLKPMFFVVGEGPLREELTAQARVLGMEDVVRFTGFRYDVTEILDLSDVLVMTSDWEGLPNVALEALSVGTPVIVTDVGGTGEVVIDGVTGYVVRPNDVEGLAEKVVRLLRDSELRAAQGRAGVEHVRQRFSMYAMASKTVTLYDSLLRERGLGYLPTLTRFDLNDI